MTEDPADRFRRLARSLEETGEMEDADGDTSSEPAEESASSAPADTVKLKAAPPEPPGRFPPAADSGTEILGTDILKAETPTKPAGEPAGKPRRIPAWRMPRRFSLPWKRKPKSGPAPSMGVTGRNRRAHRPTIGGCLVRLIVAGFFAGVALAFIASGVVIYMYYQVSSGLPSVEDLQAKAAQFETTRIYDRNGDLLYEIIDPNAGRRTYTPLSKISPYMVAATVAIEDKNYFSHPGFDPAAVLRAFYQNFSSGETVSGASTLTQQLARTFLMDPQERTDRSYLRKVREALLAVEITRRYSKEEILELYLNEFSYGSLAYGVEAAAETYFHTTADKLTLTQAAFLAGIPQAPSVYDVFTNRDATLERNKQVLVAMVEASQEQGCIYPGGDFQRVCVSAEDAGAAWAEIQTYEFTPPSADIRYPHWVNYIRQELESIYDPQVIYRSGFQVYTTLDPALEDSAETILANQVQELAAKHITGGAIVAIRPSTGEILAMVGSPDYYAQPAGQIDMAIRPRQPGSSIKPLTYAAAFEKGWTPATLIWDVPTTFPPSADPFDTSPPYAPVNYDNRFHGPVTARTALANSYNIPAVKTLQFVGIYDDPATPQVEGFLAFAKRFGITTLTRTDYGLALTLGGGEVTPLELTGAYATLANGGLRVPPVSITRITTFNGDPVYTYTPPAGEQVIRPETAFLISSILSDNDARVPMFGPNSILHLAFPAAAKTGTTNDFRDNWTLGYTPDVAIGVWVGNPDNTPMEGTTGVTGAAPIWADMMQTAIHQLTIDNPAPFVAPAGIIQKLICTVSGAEPSTYCPASRAEYFAADNPPLPAGMDLWRDIYLDTFTGLRASAACNQNNQYLDRALTIAVSDPAARAWLTTNSDGIAWAKRNNFPDVLQFYPDAECASTDPRPVLSLDSPSAGVVLTGGTVEIRGRAGATAQFDHYLVEYGKGADPHEWFPIGAPSNQQVTVSGHLADWDLQGVDSGQITIRLSVFSKQGGQASVRILLTIQKPLPTATATPTVTPTGTNTATSTATPPATSTPTALVPTVTDTETPTSTETPPPINTPTPTETPT